ncbi:DUF6655 family protein [Dongia rigui]|uniref:DUF6655 family protein n=1 Tax=Dongia rigui TaxID=940149 RepID=A0ABU5E3M4_9PROT|nr:DUF6655 family protein [Dongia rigui]MDY0874131.1 DUF6655 family protein [Dongia rigui]
MAVRALVLLFAMPALAACTSMRNTEPARTATEQLLLSTAAEAQAQSLDFGVPAGKKVFVEPANFEGYDAKYAVAAIREQALRKGLHLVQEKKDAECIIEIRAGALSADQKKLLVGIPSFDLPVPLAGGAFTFPEIAFYKRQTDMGVAKFSAAAYDAKEGTLIATASPAPSASYTKETVLLFFISWSDDNLNRPSD